MTETPRTLKRYYGKYRGEVQSNIDLDPVTMTLHRIEVSVPDVFPHGQTVWALPCMPYAGQSVGFYTKPPVGATVWVEFEGGNPDFPIWAGCFWDELEFLKPLELNPLDPAMVKVIQTASTTFVLNDTDVLGGVTLAVTDPAVTVPVTMKFSSLGVEITTGICSLRMVPEEGITLTVGETVFSMTPAGINMEAPEITGEAEGAIGFDAGGDIEIAAGGGVEINAGGDLEMAAGGAAELNAGGDLEMAAGGAVELNAGANLEMAAGAAVELNAGANLEMAAGAAAELNAGLDIEIAAGLACEINAGVDVEIAGGAGVQVSAVGDVAITSVSVAITGVTEVTGVLLQNSMPVMVLPF